MHLNELGEIINVNGEKACQFHGSNSSSFWAGCSAMRPRTSASQACGSISFILAVYAARRTMPNGFVFPRIRRDRHVIGSA